MNGGPSGEGAKIEQVVTSAGNSWIICRSKSHSGRIYYFNTLTGEAAWNLSEAEIEKAKHRTKDLASHAGIDGCPEPKEPPTDNPNDLPDLHRRQMSECINNKFPTQQYQQSPIIVPSYGLVANPINSLLPFGINAQNNNYNSNVWAVRPQIYIAPSMSLYNQPEPSYHVGYRRQQIPTASTSTYHSDRFQHTRNKTFKTPHRHFERNFGQRKDNKFVQWDLQKNSKSNLGSNDLRKYLRAKKHQKTLSQYENTELKDGHNSQKPEAVSQRDCNDNQNEKDDHGDADNDWLEDNILIEGGQLKFDVTNLKKLAKPNTDPACWYIAADKDILLNNLTFLKILCQSDEVCHVMVPEKVELELREVAREDIGRMGKRARRACVFLLQHQDAGFAVIGKATCDADNTRSQYLINCCNNLSEQNFHVILLSNENELKNLKNTSKVPIFTITEIKEFMAKPFIDNNVTKVKPPEKFAQAPIRITISNDLNETGTKDTSFTDKANRKTEAKTEVPLADTCNNTKIAEPESVSNLSDSGSSLKCIAEIGIQTDIPFSAAEPPKMTDIVVNFSKPDESRNVPTVSDPKQANDISTKTRRPIRLNRSVSNKSSAGSEDNTEQNKQFKWRKRRNVLSTQTGDSNLSSVKSCTVTQSSKEPAKINDNTDTENKNSNFETVQQLPHDRSNDSSSKRTNDDNADGSETSSIVNRNTTNDRIIIEETSTSGVISNTVSTVDSESESERRCVLDHSCNEINETDTYKSVMFEVKDKKMEDYLKIKYDEWISRFIQIMEEVLTQVLRQNKRFLCKVVYKLYGGGPWTVRDAAACIKIRFRCDSNVVEAANKLINIFVTISDDTGRITTNLCPSKYMQMYSYGVNIVNALQSVMYDCEDLEIASQSLAKLLNDIQNPHLDSSHNDTFADNIHESTGEVDEVPRLTENVIHDNFEPDCVEKSPEGPKKYNLRSKSRLSQSQDNSPVKLLQTADKQDSFFMSLNLKKKSDEINNANVDKGLSLNSENVTDHTEESVEKCRDKSTASSSYVNNKNNAVREPLDLDELDYSAYYEKVDNSDKLSEVSDEYYKKEYTETLQGTVGNENNSRDDRECDIGGRTDVKDDMKPSEDDTNKALKVLFSKIIREVKQALVTVHTFCVNTHKELRDSELVKGRKIEMLKETEEAQMVIDKLCRSLTSVFHREHYTPENNIRSILKRAGIIDSGIDCAQLCEYRDAIGKCLDQAKLLQTSVSLIQTAIKNVPM